MRHNWQHKASCLYGIAVVDDSANGAHGVRLDLISWWYMGGERTVGRTVELSAKNPDNIPL